MIKADTARVYILPRPLQTIVLGRYYHYLHFTDKEVKTVKFGYSLKVAQLSGRGRIFNKVVPALLRP